MGYERKERRRRKEEGGREPSPPFRAPITLHSISDIRTPSQKNEKLTTRTDFFLPVPSANPPQTGALSMVTNGRMACNVPI